MIAQWVAEELRDADLGDRRWERRLQLTVSALSAHPEASVPQACETWAKTKGTYRLWEAEQHAPGALLQPHIARTAERCHQARRVLLVQDSMVLNYSGRKTLTDLGPSANGIGQALWVHSVLALDLAGVPLGVLYQTTWVRSHQRAPQRRRRPPAAKESQRWGTAWQASQAALPAAVQTITVADREADVYALFAQPRPPGHELLIRAVQNRRVTEAAHYVHAAMRAQPVQGVYQVEVPRQDEHPSRLARLTLRWTTLHWQAPHRRPQPGQPPALPVQVVWAEEPEPPPGVTPLHWLLVTTLPVTTWAEAVQIVQWYTFRWRIERFHFVLKSGCRIEDLQLTTRARLERALHTYDVVAWHLLWLTYLARQAPQQPCTLALPETAWRLLQRLQRSPTPTATAPPTLHQAVRWIAQLGGFLARQHDGEPGVKTLWRGLRRLNDMLIATDLVHDETPHNLTSGYG